MERRFDCPQGQVTVAEEGGRVRCRAVHRGTEGGLWKAWLWGDGGRVLLGTLIPEGDCLRLSRSLSAAQLQSQGAWPPLGADILPYRAGVRPAPEGWRWEERPGGLTEDPLLSRCLNGLGRVLLRETEEGLCLAVPFRPGASFPLEPLFCLARPEQMEGERYAVFTFDAGGRPVLSEKL